MHHEQSLEFKMEIVEEIENGKTIYRVMMDADGSIVFYTRDDAQNYIDTYPSLTAAEE